MSKKNDEKILLDPVKSVPAYEAWIYENPSIIQSIQKGIYEIETGRTRKLKRWRKTKQSR